MIASNEKNDLENLFQSVGKSAFLVRLVTGRYLSHYASDSDFTAECDLLSEENDKVKLQITDPSTTLSVS